MLDISGFEEYLTNRELSGNTISCYIRDSKVFMDWFSSRTDCGLDKLIQLDAIGYKKHLLNTNKSVVTANRKVASVNALCKWLYDSGSTVTAIDIGGVIVEIEQESFTPIEGDIISFQLTKMRDNMLPAKKRIGKAKEEIKLSDDEYIGDFVSILYDCGYSVLMIQSNKYGLSTNQIAAYLTILRRKYIKEAEMLEEILELASELRVLIDPQKAKNVLNAKYFKRMRLKGSDFMLDAFLDKEDEGLMGKTRRLIGERTGIDFDVVISLNPSLKTESLDITDVEKLVNDFNSIDDKVKRPTVEITKKDNDDSNVELINLITPRLTDVINFKIMPRTTVGHEFLYDRMKENYKNTRGVIARVINQI